MRREVERLARDLARPAMAWMDAQEVLNARALADVRRRAGELVRVARDPGGETWIEMPLLCMLNLPTPRLRRMEFEVRRRKRKEEEEDDEKQQKKRKQHRHTRVKVLVEDCVTPGMEKLLGLLTGAGEVREREKVSA